MNDILRIARLRIALQRAFLGQAILRVIIRPKVLVQYLVSPAVALHIKYQSLETAVCATL